MRTFRLRLHGREHIIRANSRKAAILKLMAAPNPAAPPAPPVEMKTIIRLRGGQLKVITATGANAGEAKAKLIAALAEMA